MNDNGYSCSLDLSLCIRFYRAMHFSAKRGLAIACRPSVRLSLTLVDYDHIGWKSEKLIARQLTQHIRSL